MMESTKDAKTAREPEIKKVYLKHPEYNTNSMIYTWMSRWKLENENG